MVPFQGTLNPLKPQSRSIFASPKASATGSALRGGAPAPAPRLPGAPWVFLGGFIGVLGVYRGFKGIYGFLGSLGLGIFCLRRDSIRAPWVFCGFRGLEWFGASRSLWGF